jgi:type 1 glutamine amidotransferase
MKQKTQLMLVLAAVSLSLAVGSAFQPQPPAPSPGGQGAGADAPGQVPRGGQPGAPGGRRGGAGFVKPVMDTTPPELPADLESGGLLIFSKTNGYRDDASIQASNAALVAIARRRGWPVYVTENAAVMNPDQLKRFKVTVWNNTSGDTHTEAQREAFRTWLENGGAFVGIHGAGGDPIYAWAWYPETLIGAQFTEHSSRQLGTVHIEDRDSPIMQGLPENWIRTVPDEWYSFKENPRAKGMHILATADEKSYNPGRTAMGDDHPLVWIHCVGKGRVFYSAIGHPAASYTDEPLHLRMLENAMAWALGQNGGPSCPAAD